MRGRAGGVRPRTGAIAFVGGGGRRGRASHCGRTPPSRPLPAVGACRAPRDSRPAAIRAAAGRPACRDPCRSRAACLPRSAGTPPRSARSPRSAGSRAAGAMGVPPLERSREWGRVGATAPRERRAAQTPPARTSAGCLVSCRR
ncbi:hypothetical protein DMA10_00730 [Streptomyces sp. WAC 01420]|nr:hypothetical protein DMA10_00730 [Streptomyces sp. WAC 01420]